MTRVVAVIVNHNGGADVEAAAASLLGQTPTPQVVVVDNASHDGSVERLLSRFGASILLIRAPGNVGFGAANNIAIRATDSEFVLLLNSDAEGAPGLVDELLRCADAHPGAGMVAPKVLQHGHPPVIDTTGHLLYPDGLNRGRGRLEVDRGQYDAEPDALFPSGAAGLYRRRMLEEIGLFDESFFLYGEDAELGLRGRLAGWGCAFAPRAVALHRYSRTAGAYSTLKAFHVERNRVWVLLKLFPWWRVLASPAYTAARLILQGLGALVGRGAAAHLARERSLGHLVAVTLRAYVSAARGMPRVLAARRRFAVHRRVDARGFEALLRAHRLGVREVALKD